VFVSFSSRLARRAETTIIESQAGGVPYDFKGQYRCALHDRFLNSAPTEQQFACTFYVDAAPEIMAEFTKR